MSILIGKHEFDGPVANFAAIPRSAGIYATLHEDASGYLLVDIDQCDNLSETLSERFQTLVNQPVAILRCPSGEKRKNILAELINEFEYDDDEPAAASPKLDTAPSTPALSPLTNLY